MSSAARPIHALAAALLHTTVRAIYQRRHAGRTKPRRRGAGMAHGELV